MSDKSVGDHHRNIVKNPLLSNAVTSLSIEDLTHKAVLLPVTPSQGQITRSNQQQGAQTRALEQLDHGSAIPPPGDAFQNITLSHTTPILPTTPYANVDNQNIFKQDTNSNPIASKASAKSEDDFDVNEYIARLQGTRYVSAPLHSHLKEDSNANLEATDDNLEEINLNDSLGPAEVQQSLTADIAQNFSQLPTVLPHVASAVFSSFSNMLSYKSREQTPDANPALEQRSYDDIRLQKVGVGVPLQVEEYNAPKEVGPPPKEPPVGGTSNFRLTTKKKYARIPGLSSGESAQTMTIGSTTQNMPFGLNISGQNMPIGPNMPPVSQNVNRLGHGVLPSGSTQFAQNIPPFIQNNPTTDQKNPQFVHVAPTGQNTSAIAPNVSVFQNVQTIFKADDQQFPETRSQYNIFNPAENAKMAYNPAAENENTLNMSMHKDSNAFFTPIEQKENIAANIPSSAPIIPPPPMFSNMSRKEERSQSIGKSILPPSVARRISANQPIIKPQVSAPSFTENIFVPSISDVVQSSDQTANIPGLDSSAFVLAYSPNVIGAMRPEELTQPISIMQSNSQISTVSITQADSLMMSTQSTSNAPLRSVEASRPNLSSYASISGNTLITTGISPANIPSASAIFTPGPNIKNDSSNFLPVSQHAPQPTLFNPMQYTETKNIMHPITQLPSNAIPEAPALPEPPKATVSNFRMTKKRPQYYAGPIEGVGDISNNFKPIIPSAMPSHVGGSNFQGALFTPTQEPITERNEVLSTPHPSITFDISKPVGNLPQEKPTEYNVSQDYSSFNIQQSQNYQQEYNTAFDLSRDTTESFDSPNQEPSGFGIIGSLKSKLSAIDINKIQNTVTTFFDPAYNESKVPDPRDHTLQYNYGYNQQHFKNQSNLEISIAEPQNPGYNFDQYCPSQGQNSNQSAYSLSFFSDPNANQQISIDNSANASSQNFPVSRTTESIKEISQNIHSPIYPFISSGHMQNFSSPHKITKVAEPKNMNFLNQNAPAQVNIEKPYIEASLPTNESIYFYNPSPEVYQKQLFSDTNYRMDGAANYLNFNTDQSNTMPTSSCAIQTKGATDFYDSGTSESQETRQSDALMISSTTDFYSQPNQSFQAYREPQNERSYDSALNTSKYNLSNLQVQPAQSNQAKVPITSEADFFDDRKCINPQQSYMKHVWPGSETNPLHLKENVEPRKSSLETCIPPIGSKIRCEKNIDDKKDKETKLSQEKHLIASLSKDKIPILGVSTVPLFGVTALTVDDDEDIVNIGTVGSVSKDLSGLNISALKISDVENVLLIEPPLENIGSVLKRNASSTKLDNMKMEDPGIDHFRQNVSVTAPNASASSFFVDNQNENFFKHIDPEADLEDTSKRQKNDEVENDKSTESSELNICETCREVNTPDQELTPKEDLTTQLIENLTSRIVLSNSVTVPFTENDKPVNEFTQIKDRQLQQEITDIAEDTMETLQVQSATELLDDQLTSSESRTYGWTRDSANSLTAMRSQDYTHTINSDQTVNEHDYSFNIHRDVSTVPEDDYDFKLDPNAIGFLNSSSLFFDSIPQNASDEIKAEIRNTHEDIVLPRQMSIPSAPPAEDDTKSDETGGLDVLSIEQDAKKDFPLDEEFIIEPSETDDDKIVVRERKRSSEDSTSSDTFTNRIERFKKAADHSHDNIFGSNEAQLSNNPPLYMASYFDTGNYAAEAHYKKSVTPVQMPIHNYQNSSSYEYVSIPPGFENHYQNMFRDVDGTPIAPSIPDTSTQTRPTLTPTFTSSQDINRSSCEISKTKEVQQCSRAPMVEPVADSFSRHLESANPNAHGDNIDVQPLSDPINFFSKEDSKPAVQAEPESFNRLASYFAMPAPQPDHSKSFFELSESQNHYRHETKTAEGEHAKSFFEMSQSQNHYIDDAAKNNIANLMLDLTSPRNLVEQIVTTVNHFSVDYDVVNQTSNARPIKLDLPDDDDTKSCKPLNVDKVPNTNIKFNDITKLVENACIDIDTNTVLNCKYCAKLIPDSKLKVRTAVNGNPEVKDAKEMMKEQDGPEKKSVTIVNFDDATKPESHHAATVANEHRITSEYSPVKHHWFYRVDVEEKSVWRGFSVGDSQAIETTYNSSELNENTLVATDGGRYDVNVVGRLRIAVYWKEKPTNVRRCSWFYKGTTDPRYVPYTEAVAEKLDDEYKHGVTTGEWHRKLVLPNNEMVIMHGPSVMVHFLQSSATDAFSTPPSVFGKRVYRNPLKIHFPRDLPSTVDHLLFIVHGAGEFKKHIKQATSRPRVVRRGHEESEIEDCEPSGIDHLLLLCHGVGSACDLRFRSVEEVVDDFRTTSLQLLQSHYKNSYDSGIVNRVEVLPISWHSQLHSGETGVDRRLSRLTLDSIPRLRAFTNHTVLDVLFYTSPVFQQTIIDTVCSELNRIYGLFKERNPSFKGTVSLGGHSLGSVILYDLLCHQTMEGSSPTAGQCHKTYLSGTSGTQTTVSYPQLGFHPTALYALGSPIAIFECIRGVESLGMDFHLPTCRHLFNIFHPYDPIAYRIEPLINAQLERVKPQLIPHHKGRKRMHLELKDTMARVGADLKQKLIESVRTTWNKWKACPPTDGQLEKVVEEEIEKEPLCGETDEQAELQPSAATVGRLNSGRRVDYVLQEAPLEMINEYLFAMSSHVGYWESEDTMLLVLREVYSALGVQPDTTVPQQNMAVHRGDDSRINIENDHPSTSRGATS